MQKFDITYSVWKTIFSNNGNWSLYEYRVKDNERKIWTGNSEFIYQAEVDSVNYADYSSSLENVATTVSRSDDAIASIIGLSKITDPRQPDNSLKVTLVGRTGDEKIYTTHNFADRTTWFSESVQVVTESLSNSGDNLTFSGSNPSWIDMSHGKIHLEDEWNVGGTYSVTVLVDDVEQTQRLNWDSSGGDFTVNYESGSVTFFNPITGSVKASYSYENGSTWILTPPSGKVVEIEDAESQFSSDVLFNDGIVFQVYGPIDIFAPSLLDSNGGPYPSGTKIPVDEYEFKTLHQIIDEAKGAYPVIPALGGPRGMSGTMYGFPFRYGTVRSLKDSLGLDLRISLRNGIEFGGERATATFFSVIDDEF